MAGSYTLLVDWDADGDFTDANTDVTGDTLSIEWERGRNYASALLGRSIAGKLTAVLINTDGKYSPSNTSSALTGKILPGRTVRLLAGSGTSSVAPVASDSGIRWQGKLERIVPAPASHGVKTCTLVAWGVLGYLNQFETQLASQTDVLTSAPSGTDSAIGSILTDVGWPDNADNRTLETGQTTISRFWMSGKKAIEAMRLVEEAEAGFLLESKDGKVAFENRYHRLTAAASTASQATFSDASGATYSYVALAQTDPLTTITNHVEATARTFDTASIATLWTHPETGSDSPTLAPGESKTFEAEFPNPDSDNNAMEVHLWTTPAASTDVQVWTAWDASGTNLTSDITIAASKTAERMAITLTNTSASAGFVTLLKARGTAVNTKNPCIVRAIDTTSQGIYGERKYKAKTEFIPTTSQAQDWCDYQMAIYGSPIEILTMTIATSTDNNIGQVLTRDISDRITITATNDAALGISADFFIEHERHKVGVGGKEHTTTWKLSPASGGYSQFWVLGTSVLGTATVPAY